MRRSRSNTAGPRIARCRRLDRLPRPQTSTSAAMRRCLAEIRHGGTPTPTASATRSRPSVFLLIVSTGDGDAWDTKTELPHARFRTSWTRRPSPDAETGRSASMANVGAGDDDHFCRKCTSPDGLSSVSVDPDRSSASANWGKEAGRLFPMVLPPPRPLKRNRCVARRAPRSERRRPCLGGRPDARHSTTGCLPHIAQMACLPSAAHRPDRRTEERLFAVTPRGVEGVGSVEWRKAPPGAYIRDAAAPFGRRQPPGALRGWSGLPGHRGTGRPGCRSLTRARRAGRARIR